MREPQLFLYLQFSPVSDSNRSRSPFAHSVDSKDRGVREWGRIKGAGSMRLVVFGEENWTIRPEPRQILANGFSQIELLAQPGG